MVPPVSGLRGRDLVACNTAWWPSEALEMTAPAPPCLQPGDIIFTDPDRAGGHGLAARAVPHGACPFQAALQGPCALHHGREEPGMVHTHRGPPTPEQPDCPGMWGRRGPRRGASSQSRCQEHPHWQPDAHLEFDHDPTSWGCHRKDTSQLAPRGQASASRGCLPG